jgi:hypothetical protein
MYRKNKNPFQGQAQIERHITGYDRPGGEASVEAAFGSKKVE